MKQTRRIPDCEMALAIETDETGLGFWFLPVMRELARQGVEPLDGLRGRMRMNVGRLLCRGVLIKNFSYGSRAVIQMSANRGSGGWFPRGMTNETVPLIFDCWETNWTFWERTMKRGRVRTAMFTSSQAAEEMSQRMPGLRAIWVPEAIELSDYKLGGALSERSIGLLEIGRSFERFNQVIREPLAKSGVKHLYSLEGHVFPTRKELAEGLADARAVLCYPRSITHPGHAGKVETITLRYFETMAAGAIVVGHAPAELVKLFGYNPVVEIDPEGGAASASALLEVINAPEQYQELVDSNTKRLAEVGTWQTRVQDLLAVLNETGYTTTGIPVEGSGRGTVSEIPRAATAGTCPA